MKQKNKIYFVPHADGLPGGIIVHGEIKIGIVEQLDDGLLYLESLSGHGVTSAHTLRLIADALDVANAPWNAELEKAYSG